MESLDEGILSPSNFLQIYNGAGKKKIGCTSDGTLPIRITSESVILFQPQCDAGIGMASVLVMLRVLAETDWSCPSRSTTLIEWCLTFSCQERGQGGGSHKSTNMDGCGCEQGAVQQWHAWAF